MQPELLDCPIGYLRDISREIDQNWGGQELNRTF